MLPTAQPPNFTADRAALEAMLFNSNRPVGSLYIHIPFCFHKCHYCDFYSIVDRRDRQTAFVNRLVDELARLAPAAARPMETVFIGGGTPTLLAEPLWRRFLEGLNRDFECSDGTEFTVEANPETVSASLLKTLVEGGVNRMSIGAQSFHRRHLETLERWHEPESVERAVRLARVAGLRSVNLDLIFGIPDETLAEWTQDLERAIDLAPDHISAYGLTYEPNTAMTARLHAGEFELIDESIEAEMFILADERLHEAGYRRYEISNFARSRHECRHNLAYWRSENWLAAGPSASGHLDGCRWKNAPSLSGYLESTGLAPLIELERPQVRTRLAERLMMGLRLAEGLDIVSIEADARIAGVDLTLRGAIDRMIADGVIVEANGRWRISNESILVADGVIGELMRAVRP